ncbi:hypothetical protein [Reyranella sp.]|uniref:hypothetical protein n=1 Tax=Reyranella sp. TaxID=1929291 RepID=UPI003BAC1995
MVPRQILVMIVAILAAAAATPAGAQGGAAAGAKPVLVYACDAQSEPCKVWQRQWQPLFAASPAYKMIDMRSVVAPTAKDLLKPAAWPPDLRWVLDTFLMSQDGQWQEYETPRFFLLQNGEITATTGGNNSWRDYMWPTILDVTNTRP